MKTTLVLDRGYSPINIVHWQDAIRLIFLKKVEVIEEYEDKLHSATEVINMPAVVRLVLPVRKFGNRKLRLTKYRVYVRDGGVCCYCGIKLTLGEATLDHIVPRSQGGQTTWHNVVISCMDDNNMKGGRTPEQARMTLKQNPYEPSFDSIIFKTLRNAPMHEEWKFWLT